MRPRIGSKCKAEETDLTTNSVGGESEIRAELDPGARICDGRRQISLQIRSGHLIRSGALIFCLNPSWVMYPVTLGVTYSLLCTSVSSVVSASEGGYEDYLSICNAPRTGLGSRYSPDPIPAPVS